MAFPTEISRRSLSAADLFFVYALIIQELGGERSNRRRKRKGGFQYTSGTESRFYKNKKKSGFPLFSTSSHERRTNFFAEDFFCDTVGKARVVFRVLDEFPDLVAEFIRPVRLDLFF